MATKHTSPCLKKAGDDEEIFVLRAQDITSPKVILEWIKENFETCPEEKLRSAFDGALRMRGHVLRKKAN